MWSNVNKKALHIPLPTALLHDTMPHQLYVQTLQEADQSVSQSVNSTESKLAAKASGLHWVSESADEIGARSLEQDECVEGLRAGWMCLHLCCKKNWFLQTTFGNLVLACYNWRIEAHLQIIKITFKTHSKHHGTHDLPSYEVTTSERCDNQAAMRERERTKLFTTEITLELHQTTGIKFLIRHFIHSIPTSLFWVLAYI